MTLKGFEAAAACGEEPDGIWPCCEEGLWGVAGVAGICALAGGWDCVVCAKEAAKSPTRNSKVNIRKEFHEALM
jgi:hypothetical protein